MRILPFFNLTSQFVTLSWAVQKGLWNQYRSARRAGRCRLKLWTAGGTSGPHRALRCVSSVFHTGSIRKWCYTQNPCSCPLFCSALPSPPQIYMRFLEYEMHNSNECKRNFVAIYDGSGSVEHLKNKFCSTVANDVMLATSVGVVRLWADEGSRKSRFKILFTTFHNRKWEKDPLLKWSNKPLQHPSKHICLLQRVLLYKRSSPLPHKLALRMSNIKL